MSINTPKAVLILIGPSGSGKTALLNRLADDLPLGVARLKSVTTRKFRSTEDYTWYEFTTPKKFERMMATEFLVQHTKYNGAYYGTARHSIDNILASARIPILAATEEGPTAFAKADYTPLVITVEPRNYIPREGRAGADHARIKLDPQYLIGHIVNKFDATGIGFESAYAQLKDILKNTNI